MYLLTFRGNSPQGGPESATRCFSRPASARKATLTAYNDVMARYELGRRPISYMVIKEDDHIRIEFSEHIFDCEVLKAIPEDK